VCFPALGDGQRHGQSSIRMAGAMHGMGQHEV
jgi:hypothetical protein